MIIKHSEMKTVPVETVKDCVCNKCGETCMQTLGGTELKDFYGVSISVSGGYLSTHLADGVGYQFELCEKCVSEIMKGLKIPAVETEEI